MGTVTYPKTVRGRHKFIRGGLLVGLVQKTAIVAVVALCLIVPKEMVWAQNPTVRVILIVLIFPFFILNCPILSRGEGSNPNDRYLLLSQTILLTIIVTLAMISYSNSTNQYLALVSGAIILLLELLQFLCTFQTKYDLTNKFIICVLALAEIVLFFAAWTPTVLFVIHTEAKQKINGVGTNHHH